MPYRKTEVRIDSQKCSISSVPSAVQTLSDDLLKYYQQMTRAILGEDPHLMKVTAAANRLAACMDSVPALIFPLSVSGGSPGSPVQLQDCCAAAVLCLCHQRGMFESLNIRGDPILNQNY